MKQDIRSGRINDLKEPTNLCIRGPFMVPCVMLWHWYSQTRYLETSNTPIPTCVISGCSIAIGFCDIWIYVVQIKNKRKMKCTSCLPHDMHVQYYRCVREQACKSLMLRCPFKCRYFCCSSGWCFVHSQLKVGL